MEAQKLIEAKIQDQEAIQKGNIESTKKVFEENTKLLKSFITDHGWPNKENYGEKANSAAWLIAQHSDHDTNFQLQCVTFIITTHKNIDQETQQDIAYLMDRILTNNNQTQIFGTQLNGKFETPTTLTPKHLNTLRNNIGLEPIENYINRVKAFSEKQDEKLNSQ